MALSVDLWSADFWTKALTALGTLLGSLWGFMKWLNNKISIKFAKIDELDAAINNLKPKLMEFSTIIGNLNSAMLDVNKEVDQRLRDGEKRFQEHDLRFERARMELLESMNKATSEAREFHDQANENFVRKEDLKANIVMVAGEYCRDNCRDRKGD